MKGIKYLMGLMFFLSVVGISFAGITTPLPLITKINIPQDTQACYYWVSIQNERTGEIIEGFSNEHLEFYAEWANSEKGFLENDIFIIKSCGLTEKIKYTASPPTELIKVSTDKDIEIIEFNIDNTVSEQYCSEIIVIPEEVIEECIICEECICEVCSDCICPECPNCPEDITPYKECSSCCTECQECEGTNLATLILSILGLFGIGFGSGTFGYKFIIRKRKNTGKLEMKITQHKHKNVERYHSIYTIHKKQPHKKGEINPKYDSYGRYIGGK